MSEELKPDLTIRLIPEHAQAQVLDTLQKVYRKHAFGDDAIGWTEIDAMMRDALCEAMGDVEFQNWLNTRPTIGE